MTLQGEYADRGVRVEDLWGGVVPTATQGGAFKGELWERNRPRIRPRTHEARFVYTCARFATPHWRTVPVSKSCVRCSAHLSWRTVPGGVRGSFVEGWRLKSPNRERSSSRFGIAEKCKGRLTACLYFDKIHPITECRIIGLT